MVTTMRVAFYKAKHGGLDDKLIDRFSGSLGYSHCEIVMSPTEMIGAHMQTGGVNRFYYNNIYKSKYWDVLEIEVDNDKYLEFAEAMIGTRYDTLGVVLAFIGINQMARKDRVWCSELTALALNLSKDKEPLHDTLLMPNEFYTTMKDLGAKTIKSTYSSDLDKRGTQLKEIDRYGRVGYGLSREKKIKSLLDYFKGVIDE